MKLIPAPQWTPGTRYHQGDLVRHRGYLLRCMRDHHADTNHHEPWHAATGRIRLSHTWRIAHDHMLHEARLCTTTCIIPNCTGQRPKRAA